MTEEEQRQEVAVWGENMNLMKDCSLEKTDEDLYYNTEWDYTCEESELEPEDKNDPDVHKVYEAGLKRSDYGSINNTKYNGKER